MFKAWERLLETPPPHLVSAFFLFPLSTFLKVLPNLLPVDTMTAWQCNSQDMQVLEKNEWKIFSPSFLQGSPDKLLCHRTA